MPTKRLDGCFLLFPDPVPPIKLTSWERELAWLDSLPPEVQEKLFNQFGEWANGEALAFMGHMAAALLGICRSVPIEVFVAAPGYARFHQLKRNALEFPGDGVIQILESVRHGRFFIFRDLVPRNSLEDEVASCPLFLRHEDLRQALSAITSTFSAPTYGPAAAVAQQRPRKRGRTKGVGDFKAMDAPFVEQMLKLIKDGDALSVNAAANIVCERAAHGGGSHDSKRSRLRKRFREKYGLDIDQIKSN